MTTVTGDDPALRAGDVAAGQIIPAGSEPGPSTNPANEKDAVMFAWRVHDVHLEWIAKVDTKAWIGLSLQGVLIGMVVNLSIEPGRPFWSLHDGDLLVFRTAVGFLALGVVLVSLIVMPHLGFRRVVHAFRFTGRRAGASAHGEQHRSLMYFGDLHSLSPEDLSAGWRSLNRSKELDELAEEISVLARICWRKHVILLASMASWALGSLGLFVVAL